MIRGLLRLGILGTVAAVVTDRILTARAGDTIDQLISSLVVVDAPIERVWAVMADIEGQPRWMADMKSVRMLTSPPVGVGTRAVSTIRMMGVAVQDPVTITEFEPPRRLSLRHEGAWNGGGTIALEPGADGTTTIVRWDERLIPPLLPSLGAVVQRPLFASVFQRDLERLKDLVESGAA